MESRSGLTPWLQFGFAAAVCLVILIAALGAAYGEGRGEDESRETTPPDPGAVPVSGLTYRTELVGIEDGQVRLLLQDVLNRMVSGKRPPETLSGIDRRIQGHIKAFETTLRAEGYYDSKFSYRIDEQEAPIEVFIEVDHGPRYVIKQYLIEYHGPGSTEEGLPGTLEDFGMKLGAPARSEFVLDVEDLLLKRLADIGHPLAKTSDRRVVVDHADDTMSVTLGIAPGVVARFGSVTVEPPPTVDEDYVRSFLTWEEGEIFSRSKIDDYRGRLLDTGLFDSVAVERAGELNQAGQLEIMVRLSERKHRSIGLEGHWSTDEGIGIDLFWEHRNLLGKQEQLTLAARIEEIRQEFDLGFRKPRFLRENQTLLADGIWGNQDTPAYRGPLGTGFAGMERRLSEAWIVSAGIRADASNLEDFQGTRDFQLLGIAVRGVRDTSDDPLDPSRGTRLRLVLTSYYGSGEDGQVDFLEGGVSGSGYYSLREDRRVILAARARLGGLTGEESASLPANRRFYAGGGTSIRGYALQSVGPLAPDGTPLGGRSLVELGAELRVKLTKTLGGVVFIEGGNVYDDATPDFSRSLRWAAGFGARYFTAVGPFRLDFGFPLDRRPIDDPFQFYVSVGQAF